MCVGQGYNAFFMTCTELACALALLHTAWFFGEVESKCDVVIISQSLSQHQSGKNSTMLYGMHV